MKDDDDDTPRSAKVRVPALLASLCVFFSLLVGQAQAHAHSSQPMLLIVSFDGFRHDYLQMYNLSTFEALKRNGTHAHHTISQFATATFPNHWSMVTGVHEETHGIVANSMYDRALNRSFEIRPGADSTLIDWFGQNRELVQPVWTRNQLAGNGRRSATNWVGADAVFANQSITSVAYNQSASFHDLVDLFIGMFTGSGAHDGASPPPPTPINFGALYFYEPDNTGHIYGPYSSEMAAKLAELDAALAYLIEQLRSHHLYDKLNLIVTSDHGMEKISNETAVYLDSYVDTTLFEAHGSVSFYNIYVKNQQADTAPLYAALARIEHVDVFLKADIPPHLHYKDNVRVGDILLVAHLGYSVWLKKRPIDWQTTNGVHGYYANESSMQPMFIAHGPNIKVNYEIEPFETVDIYALLCYLLAIEPMPGVHASLDRVFDMIKTVDGQSMALSLLFLIPVALVVLTLAFALCFVVRRCPSSLWAKARRGSTSGGGGGGGINASAAYVSIATSDQVNNDNRALVMDFEEDDDDDEDEFPIRFNKK